MSEVSGELTRLTAIRDIYFRVGHRDFAMGGDLSPPIGGVQMGGDKAYLGGDLRVNFATFKNGLLRTP